MKPLDAVIWIGAMVMAIVTVAFCAGMAWVSWVGLSSAIHLFTGAQGLLGAYLLAGAAVTSYVVMRLAPLALLRVKKAAREYPDRISRLVVGLWELYPALWAAGFFALPATLLWPVTLAVFARWRNRQRRLASDASTAADTREVEELRAAIRAEREASGSKPG